MPVDILKELHGLARDLDEHARKYGVILNNPHPPVDTERYGKCEKCYVWAAIQVTRLAQKIEREGVKL